MLRWVIRFGLVLLVTGPAWAAPQFDAPLKTEIIPTGPKSKLHCLTFPNFLLKWVDEGELTPVIYILKGKGPWTCAATMKGELHFGSWPVVAVKGPHVVMRYPPNAAYGSSFKVFDTKRWRYAVLDTAIGDFSSVRLDSSALVLAYRRPVHMECSLYYGSGTECWGKVKAVSGLTDAMMPDCRSAYEAAKKKLDVADITDYPATVTYNAEVQIISGKLVHKPMPGPITCKP